jgi:hypothetical protein
VGGPNQGLLFLLVSCFFYYSLNQNVDAVAIRWALPLSRLHHDKRFATRCCFTPDCGAVSFHSPDYNCQEFRVITIFSGYSHQNLTGVPAEFCSPWWVQPDRLLPYVGFSSVLQSQSWPGYGNRSSLTKPADSILPCSILNCFGWGFGGEKRSGPASLYLRRSFGLLEFMFVVSFRSQTGWS